MGRGGEQLGGYRCARRGLHVDAAPVRWPRRERVLVRFVKMARPGSDAELLSLALSFTAPGDAAAPKTGAPGPGQTSVRVPNRPGPSYYGPRGGDASPRPAQVFLCPRIQRPSPAPGPSPPGPHIRPRAEVPQTGRFSFPAAARGTVGGPVVPPTRAATPGPRVRGTRCPGSRGSPQLCGPRPALGAASRHPRARLGHSRQGGRGPAWPPLPRLLTCGRGAWGCRGPRDSLAFLARGPQRSPNPASRQTSETSEAETLPRVAEPPSRSAWAVTWASGGPRRRPRRMGAQIRPRGRGAAGRLSPFASSTGFSTSTAHTLPRG